LLGLYLVDMLLSCKKKIPRVSIEGGGIIPV
jgi:hypothetical protein